MFSFFVLHTFLLMIYYIISGTLDNGQILVDAADADVFFYCFRKNERPIMLIKPLINSSSNPN